MTRMVFLIKGKVIPYTTTTSRGKHISATYQKYRAYKTRVEVAVREAMYLEDWEKSEGEPLRLAVVYNAGWHRGLHKCDLTNVQKATEDGAQKWAFRNDAWVDQIVSMRAKVDQEEDLLLLIVQPVAEGPERFSDWVRLVEAEAESRGFVL